MSERRFRVLEREASGARGGHPAGHEAGEEAGGAGEGLPAPPIRRALERDGELALDQSGGPGTHFCQRCEAEARSGALRCHNCGESIGGVGQAEFDARMRRDRAARRRELEAARERGRVVEQARERARRPADPAEEAERRDQPGAGAAPAAARQRTLPPGLEMAVVAVCLFATVSATLHLFLSAAYSDDIPWNVLAEVVIAVIVTWSAFSYLRGAIRR